jgi:predicted AlkP superfamily pyrophosphatase or phosphodiesterase
MPSNNESIKQSTGPLMLLEQIQTVMKSENNDFFYPQYRDNCISNIPDLLKDIFELKNEAPKPPLEVLTDNTCLERNEKIVLLVMDGFGFSQFLNHRKEDRFLTKLDSKGGVQSLTSVFPSQTTNALTTLNTGLTPQEHGLFEYFIYLKNIGVINTLQF